MSNNPRITIVGFGRVGSHLYYSLKGAGFKQVFKITRKSIDNYIQKNIKDSDIIFICTKDGDIMNVVRKLNILVKQFNRKIVFHTSGALNSDLLSLLKRKGAIIGSFHPIQTFNKNTRKDSGQFKNIFIAIEGEDRALKAGKILSHKLGSTSLLLSKNSKIFHHICCVICSNYLVTLLDKIAEIAQKSLKLGNYNIHAVKDKNVQINGFNKYKIFDIYKPLLMTTIHNIEEQGYIKSLTGPIERNDIKTIETHVNALRKYFPESTGLYTALGIETVKLAIKKKSINKSESKKIISKIGKSIKAK